jgi:hypothetical protein
VRRSRFEPSFHLLGPLGREGSFASYNDVLGGFEGTLVIGEEGEYGLDDSCPRGRQNTARIARTVGNVVVCRTFVRSIHGVVNRPLIDRYRPPSEVPTAYRPRGNLLFCRYVTPQPTSAVDAGDTLWDFPIALIPLIGRCTRQPCMLF